MIMLKVRTLIHTIVSNSVYAMCCMKWIGNICLRCSIEFSSILTVPCNGLHLFN